MFTTEDLTNFLHKGPSTIHNLMTLRLLSQVYVSYYQTAVHTNQLVPTISIHAFLAANEIAPMLTHLFQSSLSTGIIPSVWNKPMSHQYTKQDQEVMPEIIILFL